MTVAVMETTSASQPIPVRLDSHRASKVLDEGQRQKSHVDSTFMPGLAIRQHPSTEPPFSARPHPEHRTRVTSMSHHTVQCIHEYTHLTEEQTEHQGS